MSPLLMVPALRASSSARSRGLSVLARTASSSSSASSTVSTSATSSLIQRSTAPLLPPPSLSAADTIPFSLRRPLHTTVPSLGEVVQFRLSDIGEGIKEVTVKEWFVKVGDTVAQFDQICEVQSDKASVTITSRFDGVITKLHYEVDEIAQTGDPLVDIEVEDAGGSAEEVSEAASPSSRGGGNGDGDGGRLGSSAASGKVLATPAVRHMAAKHQLDLSQVRGSGKDGRIMKSDVLAHLEDKDKAAAPAPAAAAAPAPAPSKPAAAQPKPAAAPPPPPPSRPPPPVSAAAVGDEKDREEAFSAFTRAMFKKMSEALRIPHFAYKDEVDMTELFALREQLKKEYPDLKISYMPFVVKAASLSLLSHPRLNASVDEGREVMVYHGRHNIGVAMDTGSGLVVPNIKDVQRKSVLEIADDMVRLSDLGRRGKLGESDLKGGTFTLSNIGSIGGTYAMPVIMPPEVFIGALGKTQTLPRYLEDGVTLVPRRIMNVSWSADHRVLDGATVARFSNDWKRFLERPNLMLLSLK